MALVKVAEATGKVLDWLVGMAEGYELNLYGIGSIRARVPGLGVHAPWRPTYYWSQGGPILERESIDVMKVGIRQWRADCGPARHGLTPLIAAMRCYVTKKLGDVVEVPDELLH